MNRFAEWKKRLQAADDAFAELRLRTVLTAVVTAAIAALLLAVAPDPTSRVSTAWVTVLATVLSIALVTVLYELFLRESHAVALRNFVRLNSAVVQSGLQTIADEGDVDWRELFRQSNEMTFVLVSPHMATNYLNDILRISRGRRVQVRFCFPDLPAPPEENLDESETSSDGFQQPGVPMAWTLAAGADENLGASIETTRNNLLAAFDRGKKSLGAESSLEIALFDGPIFMEGALFDGATVLMPFEPGGRPTGSRPVCVVFGEGRSTEIRRFRSSLEEISDGAQEIEHKVVGDE